MTDKTELQTLKVAREDWERISDRILSERKQHRKASQASVVKAALDALEEKEGVK